jgi:hypothetical protein
VESERLVGVVGSRHGADYDALLAWLGWLHEHHPESIVVSGGADGVDKLAEVTWRQRFGGRVWSFRPKAIGPDSYAIEFWDLGGEQDSATILREHPTTADFKSAAIYRDALIAEMVSKLVAWHRPGKSRGTRITAGFARDYGPGPDNVWEMEAEE